MANARSDYNGKRAKVLVLRLRSATATSGHVELDGRSYRCVVGRTGRRALKREGDGATPIGRWPVREVFYRRDRSLPPRTRLPLRAIRPDDGWCDEVSDRNYNRRVRHPYAASAEHLARSDHLYDLIVVLGYNDRPRIRGRGSAIFMHLARPDREPTAGCIALSRRDLLALVASLRPGDHVAVV